MGNNLWLVKRVVKGDDIYDCADGFVIAAEISAEARAIAGDHCGDEGPDVWYDIRRVSVELIGETEWGDGVILRDFRCG